MLRLLAAIAFACLALAAPVRAQSILPGTFDAAIPTLEQVVGHRTGQQITSPAETIDYLEALQAAAPERIRLVRYATSWEGRPLVYAIVTSAGNMARMDGIKADLAALAEGRTPSAGALPVTWLGYGVHGDEISSTDAALALAYHLVASEGDATVETILAQSVVIIDPSQNPDGHARFVNGFRSQLGLAPSADRHAAEHDQPWPGGRFNHYLFDLNRDWFAMTQPETRGKIAAVREWQPVVLVDVHEMGGDETYFFPPNADPVNPHVTTAQRQKLVMLGRANAVALDRIGVPYFTREVFDLFYPGYGDTWPTLNGAVGMTFEQGSARGLVFERRDGTVLTYAEGVRSHFVTSLTTAETVARNPRAFLDGLAAFRRTGGAGDGGARTYVIDLAQRPWNGEQLARRLAAQGIRVNRVAGPASACGRRYPAGYLSVDSRQPAGPLIRSLLDADTPLPPEFVRAQEDRRSRDLPHEIYDTTAWSVGLMSGLDVASCGSAGAGSIGAMDEPLPDRTEAPGGYGLAVPWTDSGQAGLVARALAAGLVGRSTDKALTSEGRALPRGTVVFAASENGGNLAPLDTLARELGAQTVSLPSGWVDTGPSFGSASFARLSPPRIAMLWDDGLVPTSAGSVRYVIERRLGLPVTPIRTRTVEDADLSDYDVLIVPDGDPARALGEAGVEEIKDFARDGGVLVAIGDALLVFNEGEDALLSTRRETALGEPEEQEEEAADGDADEAEEKEAGASTVAGQALADEAEYRATIADAGRRPDTLPGALLNTVIDADSYLSAGYDQAAPVVFADGDRVLTPLGRADGENVVRFAAPGSLLASGYLWAENRQQMAFKPFMMAQAAGKGLVIGFVHDPTVRGYLDGLDLLLANALIVAPARIR